MKKVPPVEECKLCKRTAKLCESHIIPKFVYKQCGLIGDKKKFALHCVSDKTQSELHRQDGFKEYLLCADCEGRLAIWEGYAEKVLFQASSPIVKPVGDNTVLGGLEYKPLKLFTTSVMWRMGVSQQPYFGMVQLGSHEEVMRQMLLTENPKEPWRYGCALSFLFHNRLPLNGVFSQPQPFMIGKGRWCYRFILSGVLWNVFVSKTPQNFLNTRLTLQESGEWVLFSGELDDNPDLKEQRDLVKRHFAEISETETLPCTEEIA